MIKPNNQRTPKQIKEISKDTLKRVAILVLNTLILTFIYFSAQYSDQIILSLVVTCGYWLVFTGLIVGYIMYNRGFSQKDITPEMLPDSWDTEKKNEYIEAAQQRYKKSRWMLTIMIPVMIPIALDAIALFTWPLIQNLFK